MESDNFTTWRKATYSHGTGNCIEVGVGRRGIGVRDTTQHGAGLVLQIPTAAWLSFIDSVKSEASSHFS
jgi:Domain of unknown function (DUF397)